MSAIEKTKALNRQFVHVDRLFVNDLNPNEMSDSEFNMLADNIERVGLVDPIFVRPVEDKYRIIGGAHRYEVAKVLGFEEVPVTIIEDPKFDEDQEKFQIVRMNVIRGRMTPEKFVKLYESLSEEYAEEVVAESFGFVEEEEFKKLIKQTAKTLPKELQKEFEKAAQEIKTVDGLAKLLNSLFTRYGDTLPYGYMLLDFGGQDSVWIRLTPKRREKLLELGRKCVDSQRTMDDILGGLLEMAADGDLEEQFTKLVKKSTPVEIPSDFVGLPTSDGIGL